MTDIDEELVQTVANMIAGFWGYAPESDKEFMPEVRMEFDWADSCPPAVAWEEGPYGWAQEIPDDVRLWLQERGLFIEPINNWSAGIYQI